MQFVAQAFYSLVDFLAFLISRFEGREKAFGIGLAILFVSGAIGVLMERRHRAFLRSVREPRRALEATGGSGTAGGERVAGADEAFEVGPLRTLWRQYRQNLREQDGAFINLIDPRAWFSVESLPGRGYEKWAGTWAGVFLTVGLFFTFVGLSAALLRVGQAGAEPDQMRQAINSILAISSAKFVTSIAGIMAYIQWSLQARVFASGQTKEASALAAAVQGLSRHMTPELILFDQAATGREQLKRLDGFTDDLAIAIEQKLRSVVGERLDRLPQDLGAAVRPPLDEALKPVIDELVRFGAATGQRNEAWMEELLNRFLTEVKGGAGEEMRSVGAAIAQVVQVLESMKGQIDASGSNFEDKMAMAADLLYSAADRMDKSLAGSLGQLSERIAAIDASLQGNAQRLDEVGAKMTEDVVQGLKSAVDAMLDAARRSGDDTATALRAQIEVLTTTLSGVAGEVAAAIGRARESFVGGGEQAAAAMGAGATEASRTFSGAATKAADDFATAAQDIVAAAQEAASRVAAAGESLGVRVDQASAGLQRLSAGTDAQTQRLDAAGRRVEEAGSYFLRAGESVRDAAVPIVASLKAVEGAVSQVRQAVESHRDVDSSTRQALEQMTILTKQSTEAFRLQEDRLAQLDGALERTVVQVKNNLVDLATEMAKAFNDYDTAMAAAVGSLSNAVADFTEQLEDAVARAREEA